MLDGGAALMSIGRASGENRAQEAAQQAIQSSLLDVSIEGAQGILFNVKGGEDLSLFEVNEAAEMIRANAHPEANIIFGAVIDDSMKDELHMTVIATGFDKGRRPEQPSTTTSKQKPCCAKRCSTDRLYAAITTDATAAVTATTEAQGTDRLPRSFLRPGRPGHSGISASRQEQQRSVNSLYDTIFQSSPSHRAALFFPASRGPNQAIGRGRPPPRAEGAVHFVQA